MSAIIRTLSQRKIKTGEMLTQEDFEHREAWSEAIDRFNAKQARE